MYLIKYSILGPFTIKGQLGYQCNVLYSSNPGQTPDLAILRINNFHGYSAHNATLPIIPSDDYYTGDAVAVISYGLLRPRCDDVGPLVTKGAISKIIQHNDIPVMIQVNQITICVCSCVCNMYSSSVQWKLLMCMHIYKLHMIPA